MKVLVIGGSQGIGKDIVEHYAPNSFSVSRTNGYNINKQEDRSKILDLSLEYDAVVNHAYCGNHSQTLMLMELIDKWKTDSKSGYIFNTGSITTYFSKTDYNVYAIYKAQQDDICKRAAKKFQEGVFNFKITNIRPGMLDTDRSRQKPHWDGTGVTKDNYIEVIEFLYNTKPNIIIPEIVIETTVNEK